MFGAVVVNNGEKHAIAELTGKFDLPMIAYTPFAIFSNTIPVFDINFFSPNKNTEGTLDLGQNSDAQVEFVSESSASILQTTIASGYTTLRLLAIIGLMTVLVYIGIHILIGSVNDKAKYKERLMDWLVAMCLLFTLHYIMVFTISICENIGSLISSNCSETILIPIHADTKIDGEKLEPGDEEGHPIWASNFVGYSRLIAGGYAEAYPMKSVEFTIIYSVLVIYTVVFTIIYLRRVLYMAFLTIIAPLIALTYPIDKIHDGQAQGFNAWLKEYIFNALLQPFHILIYTIVIGSVMNLAMDYPVYALVALGFLIPAEKMLRKMFGFEKAQTPAAMGAFGLATTHLIMSGVNRLTHKPKMPGKDGKESRNEQNKVKMKTDAFDTIGTYANENIDAAMLGSGQGPSASYSNSYASTSSPFGGSSVGSSGSSALGYGSSNVFGNSSNGAQRNNNSANKRKLKNRIGDGMLSVGSRYNRKFANSHPIRSLRRGLTYGLGAASLGMVGLTAGIASGDMSKTAQYAAAAGVVGGRLGKGIGESISNDAYGNVDAFRKGWLGPEYENKMTEKAIKEAQSDPNNLLFLRAKMPDASYEEVRQVLKDYYPEYAHNGCSNIDDFWAAYQMEASGATRDTAISTYKLAQRIGDISNSPDAEEKWLKKLGSDFENVPIVQEQRKMAQEKYKKDHKELEKKYKSRFELAKSKNDQNTLEKLQENMAKEDAELKAQITKLQNRLATSALNNVKQFYQNKK